ncbi:hypothetical protein Dimus_001373 [Dionaea muscipula]
MKKRSPPTLIKGLDGYGVRALTIQRESIGLVVDLTNPITNTFSDRSRARVIAMVGSVAAMACIHDGDGQRGQPHMVSMDIMGSRQPPGAARCGFGGSSTSADSRAGARTGARERGQQRRTAASPRLHGSRAARQRGGAAASPRDDSSGVRQQRGKRRGSATTNSGAATDSVSRVCEQEPHQDTGAVGAADARAASARDRAERSVIFCGPCLVLSAIDTIFGLRHGLARGNGHASPRFSNQKAAKHGRA